MQCDVIQRDYRRTVHDDFVLNVEPILRTMPGYGAVAVYNAGIFPTRCPQEEFDAATIGWRIVLMAG